MQPLSFNSWSCTVAPAILSRLVPLPVLSFSISRPCWFAPMMMVSTVSSFSIFSPCHLALSHFLPSPCHLALSHFLPMPSRPFPFSPHAISPFSIFSPCHLALFHFLPMPSRPFPFSPHAISSFSITQMPVPLPPPPPPPPAGSPMVTLMRAILPGVVSRHIPATHCTLHI